MNDEPLPTPLPPANGMAYRAYLEAATVVLDRLSIQTYYSSPLPAPADEALAEIVSAFTGWPPPARESFVTHLNPSKRGLFALFGHRAATLAVRNNEPDRLLLGLIGNVIANSPIPPKRNVDTSLAIFYHCSRKLGLDPQVMFDEAARFATDDMAAALWAFGLQDNVALKQYGWREIRTAEGILHKFEW